MSGILSAVYQTYSEKMCWCIRISPKMSHQKDQACYHQLHVRVVLVASALCKFNFYIQNLFTVVSTRNRWYSMWNSKMQKPLNMLMAKGRLAGWNIQRAYRNMKNKWIMGSDNLCLWKFCKFLVRGTKNLSFYDSQQWFWAEINLRNFMTIANISCMLIFAVTKY